MESNNKASYTDRSVGQTLDKKVLNQMAWRSCFLQASFNYERMQAAGWLYAIIPGLKKIHTNKDDLAVSMGHNLEFFNTHPFLVTFVMGIVLSLEQQKADVQTIRSVRVAAMGPLGGIGDAIFWLTLVPIAASIGCSLSIGGSIMGPIIFLVMFNVVQFGLRFWLMHWSYKLGTNAVGMMTSHAKEFTRSATILGTFVVGALIASFGKIVIGSTFAVSNTKVLVINDIIGGIMPKLLPLLLTFLLYLLIKKFKWTTVKCICLLVVISIAGSGLGILAKDDSKINATKAEYELNAKTMTDANALVKDDSDLETAGVQLKVDTEIATITSNINGIQPALLDKVKADKTALLAAMEKEDIKLITETLGSLNGSIANAHAAIDLVNTTANLR